MESHASPYSNRELDQFFRSHEELDEQRFKELGAKADEHFEATVAVLKDIKEQTTKTNGTVASVKGNQRWMSGFSYGLGSIIAAIILPLTGYLAYVAVSDHTQLAAVQASLERLTK